MSQIKEDLKDLYIQTATQDAQIKELVRILRIELPHEKFHPHAYNKDAIPEHFNQEEEKAVSTFSRVKSLVWDALELVLPAVDDDSNKPDPKAGPSAQGSQTLAKTDCQCDSNNLVIKEVKPAKNDGK